MRHRILVGVFALVALILAPTRTLDAQFATVGGGALLSKRSPQPVAELHAETPPVMGIRGYTTLSWTDDSAQPTIITAGERSLGRFGPAFSGLGAGLLWLEFNDYRPYPIVVSSTVLPLPVPRMSLVAIASTQPFQDFEWSVVVKVGVTFWFVR